jgi:hypothetical protein
MAMVRANIISTQGSSQFPRQRFAERRRDLTSARGRHVRGEGTKTQFSALGTPTENRRQIFFRPAAVRACHVGGSTEDKSKPQRLVRVRKTQCFILS